MWWVHFGGDIFIAAYPHFSHFLFVLDNPSLIRRNTLHFAPHFYPKTGSQGVNSPLRPTPYDQTHQSISPRAPKAKPGSTAQFGTNASLAPIDGDNHFVAVDPHGGKSFLLPKSCRSRGQSVHHVQIPHLESERRP